MNHTVTLLMTEFVTHDVKRFLVSKPQDFSFVPGQGVELAINRPGLTEDAHPFTPTSLTQDRILEFTIKGYAQHDGLTKKLHDLSAGDELLLSEPFGTIAYRGAGTFIAGGAGITPFIAIFRDLAANKKLDRHGLIFSNKTPADVICEKEFRHYLGERCILTCTQTSAPGYENRHIDMAFLKEKITDFSQHFYVCGPKKFVGNVNDALKDLGARPDALVFER
jgi:ferredoxin-NADP reductase